MKSTLEEGLEISTEPARAEQKFAHLYRVTEHTCNIEYDKYTYDYTNHHDTDCGLFGNQNSAIGKIRESTKHWIERGYSQLNRDNYRKLNKDEAVLERGSYRIEYHIKPVKVSLDELIKTPEGVYIKCRDSKLITKLIKIQT